ncbi:hypothetical protein ZIOFF_071254 [Zingiber officinale]|uniref:RRM domain-containing protein n=1 Tax=Zingiber officinale TaxID=94328 RepID=A0A8J5C9G1_ZINOF|nr:hypothetical protein ZIOFF_071254 [Zingiber officinale]
MRSSNPDLSPMADGLGIPSKISVYLTLCCALAASAAGAYLHILMNIGGFLTMMGCFGSIMCLLSMPPYEEKKRFGLLMAASAFEGASIGPLIELAIEFDSRSIQKLCPIRLYRVDYACTPEEVQQHFQSCGIVNRVTILTDRNGQPKGFAYVEFLEVEAVQEAFWLHESELHGRPIKVCLFNLNSILCDIIPTGCIHIAGLTCHPDVEFVDKEAVAVTSVSRKATFYNGPSSTDFINVHDIFLECDHDSIIYLGKSVEPTIYDLLGDQEVCNLDFSENFVISSFFYASWLFWNLSATILQCKVEICLLKNGKPSWTKKFLCSKVRSVFIAVTYNSCRSVN